MSSVKTYQSINKSDKSLHFSISKMEDIYDKRKGAIDEPHRHNFYTVLIIRQAKGFHKIDFNSYQLSSYQLYFVAPGQVHQVIEEEQTKGIAMTFSTDFLVQNSIPISFISDLNLFQNYGETPPLTSSQQQFESIENLAKEIFQLYKSNQNKKLLSIGAYLKILLIQCSNICTIEETEEKEYAFNSIIRSFKNEVDNNFKKEHSSSFYAQLLNITPDHLNRTVKDKLGKTAKEYIQSRIITEAKRLLYFTDLTNKEIGYELGFNEPANFSAFFKKCTQSSPSDFKKKEQID